MGTGAPIISIHSRVARGGVRTEDRKDKFIKLPLWFAIAAAEATRSPKALVWVYLVRLSWEKHGRMTFALPNEWLEEHGVSREVKRRALRDLERAGMILVDRRDKRSPIVTLIAL
jgi:hypothetical protein